MGRRHKNLPERNSCDTLFSHFILILISFRHHKERSSYDGEFGTSVDWLCLRSHRLRTITGCLRYASGTATTLTECCSDCRQSCKRRVHSWSSGACLDSLAIYYQMLDLPAQA